MTARIIVLFTSMLILGSTAQAFAGDASKSPLTDYNPTIDPARFSARVTHKYLTLTPRKKMIYEAKTEEGVERVEYYVTEKTQTVMGVECTVVRDRAWLDGDLIEDTQDYLAQDDQGNVWYFGEASKEMSKGKVVSTEGSWEAGVGSAKPGIMMVARPTIGVTMRQEYDPGKAEDQAEVIAVDETITIPFGELTGCVRTREHSPLEPNVVKHRCYCPEVGGVALEADPAGGEETRLLSVEYDADPTPEGSMPRPASQPGKITEDQAKAIALRKVAGKVTEVSIERKFGKLTYVIEIQVKDGPETDVIIDMQTGEVLGTEI
jgi:Peptidase propeptide and YPEB domain